MSKRKSNRSLEEDLDHYRKKIKKLERKIQRNNSPKSVSDPQDIIFCEDENIGADTPVLRPDDWLLYTDTMQDNSSEPQPGPSSLTEINSGEIPEETTTGEIINTDLDTEILEILGDDPTNIEKFAPEIRSELARRLLHITKEGLSKEVRKSLILKYPVPANCTEIDAPKMNPETKAAIIEAAVKRDKGIETKQKQMTSAIACISGVINTQLSAKNIDNVILQKLMDVVRILCDLQHAHSVTRRNFILFSLKNDMREHLKNTKIDSFLFGESLAETLKCAKAVNKSGVELKAESNTKSGSTKYKGPVPRHLNRKAPPQARRPPAGPAPPAPRSREPVAARAPYHQPMLPHQPSHGQSSKTSSQAQQATYPRRRY